MSAEVSCITLLWHFEFASPIAVHGGGSDLNTCSQRSGDKEWAQPGCCQKPRNRVTESHLKHWCICVCGMCVCVHVRLCLKSRQWHIRLHEWRCVCIHASKSAPGCVHLCMCSVFAKGEGFSAFNYSSAKTLHVHSRASQPTDPDTLLRGSSWRKQTREEAWYTHFMGSSTNQLFKYYFFLAASLSMTAAHHQGATVPFWIHKQILIKLKVTYEKYAATNFI